MDVSNQIAAGSTENLDGQELIRTVVSLTGMPEALMHEELGNILEFSGKDAETLTLEQLRQALLVYLESLDRLSTQEDLQEELSPALSAAGSEPVQE